MKKYYLFAIAAILIYSIWTAHAKVANDFIAKVNAKSQPKVAADPSLIWPDDAVETPKFADVMEINITWKQAKFHTDENEQDTPVTDYTYQIVDIKPKSVSPVECQDEVCKGSIVLEQALKTCKNYSVEVRTCADFNAEVCKNYAVRTNNISTNIWGKITPQQPQTTIILQSLIGKISQATGVNIIACRQSDAQAQCNLKATAINSGYTINATINDKIYTCTVPATKTKEPFECISECPQ